MSEFRVAIERFLAEPFVVPEEKKKEEEMKKKDDDSKVINSIPTSLGALSENFPTQISTPKFYITTAIAYTNGLPHIGHAYEFLSADVLARFHRLFGENTYFLTGSDEHGQKVANSAEKVRFFSTTLLIHINIRNNNNNNDYSYSYSYYDI